MKDPYYVNLAEVEFKDSLGTVRENLTELVELFSIEERILFVTVSVNKGEFLKTLESLMDVCSVTIKYFDREGSVGLQVEGRCEFINTWSSFLGDYNKTLDVLKIRASFVLKSMEIKEQTDWSITNKIMF